LFAAFSKETRRVSAAQTKSSAPIAPIVSKLRPLTARTTSKIFSSRTCLKAAASTRLGSTW
jgi:hypothetical protein